MKVAVIGTVGVPACYGGFETLVENLIGDNCSSDIEYTVFCSSKNYSEKKSSYKKAKLKYIPFKANGIQSLLYDTLSLIKSMKKYDLILYLGVSVPIINIMKKLCRGKIIANIDGLSQDRGKYNKFEKQYLNYLTANEILKPDAIISDNEGIKKYAKEVYGRDSYLIAYGGDQVLVEMSTTEQDQILEEYNLNKGEYAISVCRIEPENNIHLILEAFEKANKKIFFIGNWDKSEYGRNLILKYKDNSNIILQKPIYDQRKLYALRKNADIYIHGHSVGGTNPSLVEAMFFGIPILCYDVIYNRSTTFNEADYFNTVDDLISLLNKHKDSGEILFKRALDNYTWKDIIEQYERVYREVVKHN